MTYLDPEYLKRASDQADQEIRKRSVIRIPAYILFFVAILLLTPITRKHSDAVYRFGALILIPCVSRAALTLGWQWFSSNVQKHAQLALTAFFYLTAISWGLFNAWTILFFELGWVSFFVVLATCALVAGEVSALAPRWPFLYRYLILMLVPSTVVSFLVLSGLSGLAMGIFFLGYFTILALQGHVQFVEYWNRLRENAQLQAMIDATPGLLAWVSSDFEYLGTNRRTANLWKAAPEEIRGQKLGFFNADLPLEYFVRSLFETDKGEKAGEIQLEIQGRKRDCFVFGQTYNLGTEAILLGLDMTEYRASEKSNVRERAQRLANSRLANLGEVSQKIFQCIRSIEKSPQLPEILATVEQLFSTPTSTPLQKIDIRKLLKKAVVLLGAITQSHGIRLISQIPSFETSTGKASSEEISEVQSWQVKGNESWILEVLVSLVINSVEALQDFDQKEIRIELSRTPDNQKISLSVIDSGKGIPEAIRSRLFEPLFTTKPDGQISTGVGLSTSRELVEQMGGTLNLDPLSLQTRFVITLRQDAGESVF